MNKAACNGYDIKDPFFIVPLIPGQIAEVLQSNYDALKRIDFNAMVGGTWKDTIPDIHKSSVAVFRIRLKPAA